MMRSYLSGKRLVVDRSWFTRQSFGRHSAQNSASKLTLKISVTSGLDRPRAAGWFSSLATLILGILVGHFYG